MCIEISISFSMERIQIFFYTFEPFKRVIITSILINNSISHSIMSEMPANSNQSESCPLKKVAVFCGASLGFKEVYRQDAIALGEYFAEKGIGMVYGGGKIGMMGAIADAMLRKNGEVIGVIPHLLRHEEVAHADITEMHVSKTMSERKVTISKMVDGYIALAGGFGTLDEIFEALTLGQLAIENKPVGILNTNGFFDALLNQLDVMVKEGFLRAENRKMLIVSNSIPDLIDKMNAYQAPKVSKLVDTVGS
jgi:uncharacterized protein (TIGR00730 family)